MTYLDPQRVVNGHPLEVKGLLMDTLSVVLVHIYHYIPIGPEDLKAPALKSFFGSRT